MNEVLSIYTTYKRNLRHKRRKSINGICEPLAWNSDWLCEWKALSVFCSRLFGARSWRCSYEEENGIVCGGIFLFAWNDLNNLIASRLGVLILASIWGKRNKYSTL